MCVMTGVTQGHKHWKVHVHWFCYDLCGICSYLQDNPGEIHLGNIVGILCRFQIAANLIF